MEYRGDTGLYLSGAQVPIRQCGIYITPPTIRQIVQHGEDDFLVGVKLLSSDRMIMGKFRDADPNLKDADNFTLLLLVVGSDDTTKAQLETVIQLMCPDYDVEVSKNSINFRQGDEGAVRGQINQFNFEYFSNTVKELFWPPMRSETDYNPVNEKAEEIARKLERGREIANKDKPSAASDKGSLFGTYASILSVGMNLDINVIYGYTPFQLYDVFNRYTMKTQYDMYMKIKTTPMMSVEDMEEPRHWMENLYHIVDDDS